MAFFMEDQEHFDQIIDEIASQPINLKTAKALSCEEAEDGLFDPIGEAVDQGTDMQMMLKLIPNLLKMFPQLKDKPEILTEVLQECVQENTRSKVRSSCAAYVREQIFKVMEALSPAIYCSDVPELEKKPYMKEALQDVLATEREAAIRATKMFLLDAAVEDVLLPPRLTLQETPPKRRQGDLAVRALEAIHKKFS